MTGITTKFFNIHKPAHYPWSRWVPVTGFDRFWADSEDRLAFIQLFCTRCTLPPLRLFAGVAQARKMHWERAAEAEGRYRKFAGW